MGAAGRAQRRGEAIPPIDVYRIGDLHFVKDGHHRVSVAHALGLRQIDAFVTEVTTVVDETGIGRRGDLVDKDLRRVFLDRVPLPGPALATILVTTPWSYPCSARPWRRGASGCGCSPRPGWPAGAPTPRRTWSRPPSLRTDGPA